LRWATSPTPLAGGWLSGRWGEAAAGSHIVGASPARFDMNLPDNSASFDVVEELAQIAEQAAIPHRARRR
jgi:hypothetical protein